MTSSQKIDQHPNKNSVTWRYLLKHKDSIQSLGRPVLAKSTDLEGLGLWCQHQGFCSEPPSTWSAGPSVCRYLDQEAYEILYITVETKMGLHGYLGIDCKKKKGANGFSH